MRYYCVIAMILASLSAFAEEPTWLRHHDVRSRLIHYADPAITMQAARFEPPAPGIIRTISLKLGGENKHGKARLHIYGSEAGLSAPLLEKDIIRPITVSKSRSGTETITIDLPDPVHIAGPQFFIAIDNMDPGVTLLSDRTSRMATCVDKSGSYYYQALKTEKDEWRWGKYAYCIDVDMVYDKLGEPALVDVTARSGLPETPAGNSSIAWADYNDDGFLDILAGGKLYRNKGDGTFTDATSAAGLGGIPKAHCFIDIDNDADIDILFMHRSGSDDSSAILFRNNSDGRFERQPLPFPHLVDLTSFSMADINGDGYIDLFLGQGPGSSKSPAGNVLLLNMRGKGFTADTQRIADGSYHAIPAAGSQWTDYNNDGHADLFITSTVAGIGYITLGDGKGGFHPGTAVYESSPGRITATGCSWGDYDNDGDMDLLLPGSGAVASIRSGISESAADVFINEKDAGMMKRGGDQIPAEFIEHHAGGSWSDVNNDGLLDYIITTSCGCSYADLHIQMPGGNFERKTAEYGLYRVPAGEDAVWADYDNDGRIDLAVMQEGIFRLYRNQKNMAGNNYIGLDLAGPAGSSGGIGGRVTVHAGERKYTREVTSGRGLLMQDPLRLHIGIGNANAVDSVTVRWPGSRTTLETFTGLNINAVNRLKGGHSTLAGNSGMVRVDAYPNPFSAELKITYTLPSERHARLTIYSMTGEEIITLVDRKQPAGAYSVAWNGASADGRPLSQGTYIYRLTAGDSEVHGRAILAR